MHNKAVIWLFALLTLSIRPANASTPKKVLIVQYSTSGNSLRVSEMLFSMLSSKTDCNMEKLKSPGIRNNFFSNVKVTLLSIWDGKLPIFPPKYNPHKYTDIVFCFPIWMDTVALPIQTYFATQLSSLPSNIRLHVCATYRTSTDEALASSIQHICCKYNKKIATKIFIKSATLAETNHKFRTKQLEYLTRCVLTDPPAIES